MGGSQIQSSCFRGEDSVVTSSSAWCASPYIRRTRGFGPPDTNGIADQERLSRCVARQGRPPVLTQHYHLGAAGRLTGSASRPGTGSTTVHRFPWRPLLGGTSLGEEPSRDCPIGRRRQ
jgi:hypothetical protein